MLGHTGISPESQLSEVHLTTDMLDARRRDEAANPADTGWHEPALDDAALRRR